MMNRVAPGILYACWRSAGSWEVREAAHFFPDVDDKIRGVYPTQRKALNACGRSWFTVAAMPAHLGGEWIVEENRVGELRTETTIHQCSSGGEAHRLRARLVGDGLVYVEGVVP